MNKKENDNLRKRLYDKFDAEVISSLCFYGILLFPMLLVAFKNIAIYFHFKIIITVLNGKVAMTLWMVYFGLALYISNYLGPYVGYIKEFPSMKDRLLYIRKARKRWIFTFGGRQLAEIFSNLDKNEIGGLIITLSKDYIQYQEELYLLQTFDKYKEKPTIEQYYIMNNLIFDNELLTIMKFRNIGKSKNLIDELFKIQNFELKKYTKEQIVELGFGGFISEKPGEMTEILNDVQMSEDMYKELISFLINNLSSKDKIQYEKLTKENEYVKLSNEEKVNVLCSFMPSLINNDTYEEYFKTLKYKNKVLGEEINKKLKTMRYLSDEELYKLNLHETLKG